MSIVNKVIKVPMWVAVSSGAVAVILGAVLKSKLTKKTVKAEVVK
jgi:hypothetical protein